MKRAIKLISCVVLIAIMAAALVDMFGPLLGSLITAAIVGHAGYRAFRAVQEPPQ